MAIKYGQRVAVLTAWYIDGEARGVNVIFGSEGMLEGTSASEFAGFGFTGYLKYREFEFEDGNSRKTFGGYLSAPKLNKDDKYEDGWFYINLDVYNGENDNIAYLVNVSDVQDGKIGKKIFAGSLFKGRVKGMSNGTISEILPDEETKSTKSRKSSTKSKKTLADDDDVPF